MGCFDYTCQCDGAECDHTGGQKGDPNLVMIEIPLNDGTNVYIRGEYNLYGEVLVDYKNDVITFYPEEFREYFECWLEDQEEKRYLANKVWTVKDQLWDDDDNKYVKYTECGYKYSSKIVTLTDEILKKCIAL